MSNRGKMMIVCILACMACFIFYLPETIAAEKGPIKIGFLAPQTGNFAQFGLDMTNSAKMYLEQNNYTVAGRKIEVVWEDEGPGPDTAVTKTRKLIKQDRVHLIAGVFMTASAYAVAAVCTELETPLFITISGGDDLTQRKSSKYVSRLSLTGGDWGHVVGDYAYKELGWRKVATIGMDYGAGHEGVGGFHAVFESLGGQVIQKLWVPMTTMDFGPYVSSIKSEADGVWDVVTGAMSIRLLKSMRESGILNKMGIMAAGSATDESLLPALGDTALGVLTVMNYSGALDNPKNKQFRELCKQKLNRDPTWPLMTSWVGFEWIFKAVNDIQGDVENKDKLCKGLRAVKMEDSVKGPLRMDDYGHPLQDYYIRRVDKVGDGYQNTVIKTYPAVSQFWTWDPKTFLSRPVYSRDYPPCKFCK